MLSSCWRLFRHRASTFQCSGCFVGQTSWCWMSGDIGLTVNFRWILMLRGWLFFLSAVFRTGVWPCLRRSFSLSWKCLEECLEKLYVITMGFWSESFGKSMAHFFGIWSVEIPVISPWTYAGEFTVNNLIGSLEMPMNSLWKPWLGQWKCRWIYGERPDEVSENFVEFWIFTFFTGRTHEGDVP